MSVRTTVRSPSRPQWDAETEPLDNLSRHPMALAFPTRQTNSEIELSPDVEGCDMNVDEETIRNRSTGAVFERGQTYRDEGRIQQLDRFGDLVTATVSGSQLYDVTVEFGGRSIDTTCTCPYDGRGDCKHVVAVLLDIATGPPQDDSERVEAVLEDVSAADLRAFVSGVLAEHSELREQFLARFGDDNKSVAEYREEIAHLFEQHADPVVFEAIDFSRFFEIAEQYRDRERYLAAARKSTRNRTGSTGPTTTTHRPSRPHSTDTPIVCLRPIRAPRRSIRTLAYWKREHRQNRRSTANSSGAHSTTSKSDTRSESRNRAVRHSKQRQDRDSTAHQ